MARVRISTTVDADLLSRGRELLSGPDGRLVDAALQALVDVGDADRERAALDGTIPPDVLELARRRRRG